jgi:DhnA family fructose-bisphosphate aldolase class Ia
MEAGAGGLVFGRNIDEAPDPAAELARFRRIVHGE